MHSETEKQLLLLAGGSLALREKKPTIRSLTNHFFQHHIVCFLFIFTCCNIERVFPNVLDLLAAARSQSNERTIVVLNFPQ